MTLNLDTFLDFRWEAYQIELYKKTLARMEKSPNDLERDTIIRHMSLMHLFLKRFSCDPGFHRYVTRMAYEDNLSRRIIERDVSRLSDRIQNTSEFDILPNRAAQIAASAESERSRSPVSPVSPRMWKEEILNRIHEGSKETLAYLAKRLEAASKRDREADRKAISWLMIEYVLNSPMPHLLLLPNYPLQKGSLNLEQWHSSIKRYVISNVKASALYLSEDIFGGSMFRSLISLLGAPLFVPLVSLASSPRLIEYVRGIMVTNLGSPQKIREIEHSGFTYNIIQIACLSWFNRKAESEKLRILNKYYPFFISADLLEEHTRAFGTERLLRVAGILDEEKLLDEAKGIYLYVLSKSNDDSEKYLCYNNLVSIYIRQQDTKSALSFYSELSRLSENLHNRTNFMVVSGLVKKSEIHYLLGELNEAERGLSQIEEIAGLLSEKERIIVWSALADFFRRIGNFEKESNYQRRITGVPSHIEGNLADEAIKKIRKREMFEEHFDKGMKMLFSFQFESAIKWFQQAREADNSPDALVCMGFSHFLWGQYDPTQLNLSRDYYEKAVSIAPDENFGLIHLGIIKTILGDKEAALDDLVRATISSSEKGDFSSLALVLAPACLMSGALVDFSSTIQRVAARLPISIKKDVFYNDIGRGFTECGFVEEGTHYYEEALKGATSSEIRAVVLSNMGRNFMCQDLVEDAMLCLQKATRLEPECGDAWANLALIYLSRLDGSSALDCIDKAIKNATEVMRSFLEALRELCVTLVENALKLHYVEDEGIRKMLFTAEFTHYALVESLFSTQGGMRYDLWGFLVDYFRALEGILHIKIGSQFKRRLLRTAGRRILSKEYWRTYRRPSSLLRYLKVLILKENGKINLGPWSEILGEIESSSEPQSKTTRSYTRTERIEEEFKEYIRETLSPEEIKIIKEACSDLNSYRLSSAHAPSDDSTAGIESKAQLKEIRRKIVVHLNKVIDIFYSPERKSKEIAPKRKKV